MNGLHYETDRAVCSGTRYCGPIDNTGTVMCSDTGYCGPIDNTGTVMCSDTRYFGPIHNIRTGMCQVKDIQVFFALFEQQRLALSTIMWTVLFKHCTAYLNLTWVSLKCECVNEKYILCGVHQSGLRLLRTVLKEESCPYEIWDIAMCS